MTDEQVDRIVKALDGSGEEWTTLIVALVAALFGALLTLGLQWIADQKKASEAVRSARTDAARAGAELAARFALTPSQTFEQLLQSHAAIVAPVRVQLVSLERSETVAKWWTRQITRLSTPPMSRMHGFSRAEFAHRGDLARSVQTRLSGWAVGDIPVESFKAERDDEWDEIAGVRPIR